MIEELEAIARKYVEQNPPLGLKDDVLKRETIRLNAEIFEKFLVWLDETHCIVCRDFVKHERLVIEGDRKLMLEKTTGERMVMAGVYQAKLELMEKLFGKNYSR